MKTSESVVARESHHTQLPWKLTDISTMGPKGESDIAYQIDGAYATYVGDVTLGSFAQHQEAGIATARANAEFIVRACNSHEKLVEALQACRDSLCSYDGHANDPNDPKGWTELAGYDAYKLAEQALRLAQGEK